MCQILNWDLHIGKVESNFTSTLLQHTLMKMMKNLDLTKIHAGYRSLTKTERTKAPFSCCILLKMVG